MPFRTRAPGGSRTETRVHGCFGPGQKNLSAPFAKEPDPDQHRAPDQPDAPPDDLGLGRRQIQTCLDDEPTPCGQQEGADKEGSVFPLGLALFRHLGNLPGLQR